MGINVMILLSELLRVQKVRGSVFSPDVGYR
jgi:hypothetical protein